MNLDIVIISKQWMYTWRGSTHAGISPTRGRERGEEGALESDRVLLLCLSFSTTSFSMCSWPGSKVRVVGTASWGPDERLDWNHGNKWESVQKTWNILWHGHQQLLVELKYWNICLFVFLNDILSFCKNRHDISLLNRFRSNQKAPHRGCATTVEFSRTKTGLFFTGWVNQLTGMQPRIVMISLRVRMKALKNKQELEFGWYHRNKRTAAWWCTGQLELFSVQSACSCMVSVRFFGSLSPKTSRFGWQSNLICSQMWNWVWIPCTAWRPNTGCIPPLS